MALPCPMRSKDWQSGMTLACPIACGIVLVGGCGPVVRPSFDSPEPAARNAAIVEAARSRDQGSVDALIDMLASDDPATRVLAIRTLYRITGEDLGYDPHAEAMHRAQRVRAWRAWLADRGRSAEFSQGAPAR